MLLRFLYVALLDRGEPHFGFPQILDFCHIDSPLKTFHISPNLATAQELVPLRFSISSVVKYEGSSNFEVLDLVPLRLISPPKLFSKSSLCLHSLLFGFELNTLTSSILLLFELFNTSLHFFFFLAVSLICCYVNWTN